MAPKVDAAARADAAGSGLGHPSQRQPGVDLAKAVAAGVIMLHHFSLYGPLADALHQAMPDAARVLARYGRYAVQVFLVLGGYLATQSLLRNAPRGWPDWLRLAAQRWWRLAAPFTVAVVITLLAHAATARHVPELLPQDIRAWSVLAHLLLLHGVTDVESLTVGAWYVAIDFQLFVLVAAVFTLGVSIGSSKAAWAVLLGLSLASLWIFNRDEALDDFAVYFLGSYGLGCTVAGLQGGSIQEPRWRTVALLVTVAVALALVIEWRGRLLWALGTAWFLLLHQHPSRTGSVALSRVWQMLGERAFGLFLLHFAVWLLANALFVVLDGRPGDHGLSVALMCAACIVSCLAADLFFRWVERPASRLRWGPQMTSTGIS